MYKRQYINNLIQELNLQSNGRQIEIRDYQLDAVSQAIRKGRTLLLSPTGSGKSLIIFTLVHYHSKLGRKQLIVVPTTSLVEQMYGDFADYASAIEWDVSKNCHRIYSGKEKSNEAPIVISTWQSIYKFPKSWFDSFDVIYGDEAHLFKAKSLTTLMDKLTQTPYRIGTTGTLDGAKTNKLVLEGVFGPVHKVTTTKKLMDDKQLADLKIVCLLIEYPDEQRKVVSKMTYQEEIDWIISNPKRNNLLSNLALSQTGNTQDTLNLRNYSNDTASGSSLGPFTVTSSTQKVDTRARARAIALKVENTGSSQDWKLGTFRLDIQPDGRR